MYTWGQADNYYAFDYVNIAGWEQEKSKNLRSVTRKTVGAMRIVAKFRAGWWWREVEGSFL